MRTLESILATETLSTEEILANKSKEVATLLMNVPPSGEELIQKYIPAQFRTFGKSVLTGEQFPICMVSFTAIKPGYVAGRVIFPTSDMTLQFRIMATHDETCNTVRIEVKGEMFANYTPFSFNAVPTDLPKGKGAVLPALTPRTGNKDLYDAINEQTFAHFLFASAVSGEYTDKGLAGLTPVEKKKSDNQ